MIGSGECRIAGLTPSTINRMHAQNREQDGTVETGIWCVCANRQNFIHDEQTHSQGVFPIRSHRELSRSLSVHPAPPRKLSMAHRCTLIRSSNTKQTETGQNRGVRHTDSTLEQRDEETKKICEVMLACITGERILVVEGSQVASLFSPILQTGGGKL